MRTFLKDYLELVAYLIYTILLFFSFKKSGLLRHKVLYYYYLFATALLLEASVFFEMDNNWNYNLLFLLTIIIFSWYFKNLFLYDIRKTVVNVFLGINIAVFIYYNVLRGQFFNSYNNYVYSVSFITIVIFTLMYFHQLLLNVKEESILLDLDFWLICGYLLYFLGSFFIILYYKDAPSSQRGNIWASQNIILFLSAIIALKGYSYIANRKNSNNLG